MPTGPRSSLTLGFADNIILFSQHQHVFHTPLASCIASPTKSFATCTLPSLHRGTLNACCVASHLHSLLQHDTNDNDTYGHTDTDQGVFG